MDTEDVVIDALPYVDEYTDRDKAIVEELIKEEILRGEVQKKDPDELFGELNFPTEGSIFLKTEFERMSKGEPMEKIDATRYQLGVCGAEWRRAVENDCAQLAHQCTRKTNLELLSRYGGVTWLKYNSGADLILKNLTAVRSSLNDSVETLKAERLNAQRMVSSSLQMLHQQYLDEIRKNNNIRSACRKLEEDIAILKAKIEEKEKEQAKDSAKQI